MSIPRTVITGIGVVAPNGVGRENYWKALLAEENGIGELTRFDASRYPARQAGQIDGFEPRDHILPFAAADRCLHPLCPGRRRRSPGRGRHRSRLRSDRLQHGCGHLHRAGRLRLHHREFRKLWSQGPEYVSVYESFAWFYAVNTGQISIRHGMRGPGSALVGEQAGGLDAIGHARRTVRAGTRVVLTGGVDSALDPWGGPLNWPAAG